MRSTSWAGLIRTRMTKRTGAMNEHEMCCGTVADKSKLCAEIAERDAEIAHLHEQLNMVCEPGCTPLDAEKLRHFNHALSDELADRDSVIAAQLRRISALQIAEDAHARVAGRTLKFAMERGYNPASEENELEYIMRRFDEMAAQLEQLRGESTAIMDESTGVAGYHLNGQIAQWDEFSELEELG